MNTTKGRRGVNMREEDGKVQVRVNCNQHPFLCLIRCN